MHSLVHDRPCDTRPAGSSRGVRQEAPASDPPACVQGKCSFSLAKSVKGEQRGTRIDVTTGEATTTR